MSLYPASASRLPSSTSATTTERPSVAIASSAPRETRRMIDLNNLGMPARLAMTLGQREGNRACSATDARLMNPEQASALRQMRAAVPSGVTASRVRAALRWTYDRAKRWVAFAKAKRRLTEAGEWT